MKDCPHTLHALLATAVIALAFSQTTVAYAQSTNTWVGGNTTNDFNNAANWSPSGVPNGVDSRAVFTSLASTSWTNSTITLGSLFNSGGNLTLGTTAITSDVLRLETSSGTPVISNASDVFFYANLEGSQGFQKTGAGRFTFRFNSAAQSYSGNILVSQGVLGINQDTSLGDTNNDITIGNGARLLAEPGSNSGTITLGSSRTITLAGTQSQLGANTAAVNMVIEGDILETAAGNGLVKTDAGVVTLAGNVSYSGETRIAGGTLRLTNAAALPTGQNLRFNQAAAATLDVTDTSQTVRTIVMDNTTANRTITGSGGSLTVNGDANLQSSANNGVTYSFAGLDAFTYSRTNRNFNFQTANVASVTTIADLNLAKGGAGGGTNTISAGAILVGGGNSDGNNGNIARLHLGANNTFNAGTLTVGGFNAGGIIDFQSGLSSSNLTLRGADGSSAMTTLTVGETSSGSRNGQGVLDLGGGSLDAFVTEIRLGRHISTANISDTSSISMGDGTLTASTLVLATKTGGGMPTLTSTFNQNGGTVTIAAIALGDGAGTEAAVLLPTYNLNGGSLAAATIGAGAGTSYNTSTSARTLGLDGGTLRNASGQNLEVDGLNTMSSGRINVVLGASGGTIEADAAHSVTFGANTSLSGAGDLTKTGAGTLILSSGVSGANTGALIISGGMVNLAGSGVASAGAVSSVAVATNAVLLISHSNQLNDSAGVSLSGGTIQRGAGVSEVFGNLNIAGGSTLDFGAGSVGDLQFQSYTYSGSSAIELQNFLPGNRLQFLSTSFTSANLTQFDFNGFGYVSGIEDGYFTITAIPESSTYAAAAGLLGLMLWPARRRLLKEAQAMLVRPLVRRP